MLSHERLTFPWTIVIALSLCLWHDLQLQDHIYSPQAIASLRTKAAWKMKMWPIKCLPLQMKHFRTSNDFFSNFLYLPILWQAAENLYCVRIYTQDKLSVFVLFVFTLLKANMSLQAFGTNCLHVFPDVCIAMLEFAHLIQYQTNRSKPQSVSTLFVVPKIFLPSKSHAFTEIWM